MNRRFALTLALGFSTLATVALTDTAEAGRYRYGGGGRVRVHAHAGAPGGVSVRYSRPVRSSWRPRTWSVGGHVWVGGGYYPRYRYYRPYYYYQPVPSYYGYYSATYYPVAPSAAPSTTAAVVAPEPRPALPKFGLGLFAGGISVEDRNESSDIGVLARLRLTTGLLVEGELGKQRYEDAERVDRRMGVSLVYEIGAYNKLAPYLLGGMGVQQADVAGAYETTQNYGELGVGLRLALSPQFHVLFDVRAGSRNSVSSDAPELQTGTTARTITPPAPDSDETEEYTRGRLSAVLYF